MLMLMLIAFATTIFVAASLAEPSVSRSTDNSGESLNANFKANPNPNLNVNPNVNLEANRSSNLNCINFSRNASSIRLESQSRIAQAPATVSVGKGYYSSHPISYGNEIGSETWVKNGGAATSMHHAVRYAHGVDGVTEIEASESSYDLGDFVSSRESGTRMMVDENVTEGQVHIGALQGDESSGQGASGNRIEPTATALENPTVQMEEDYTGTYHIYKNMNIDVPLRSVRRADSWLDFCGGECFDGDLRGPWSYLSLSSVLGFYPWPISEDKVFNCNYAEAGRRKGSEKEQKSSNAK